MAVYSGFKSFTSSQDILPNSICPNIDCPKNSMMSTAVNPRQINVCQATSTLTRSAQATKPFKTLSDKQLVSGIGLFSIKNRLSLQLTMSENLQCVQINSITLYLLQYSNRIFFTFLGWLFSIYQFDIPALVGANPEMLNVTELCS